MTGMKHLLLLLVLLFAASPLFGHCDWIKGPVVLDAQAALEKGDLGPVMKWIPAAGEPEVRQAFTRTMSVRKASPEGRELADRWFFETVVRLHRASEGEPYNGLRGLDYTPDPAIVIAERALEQGSLVEVEKALLAQVRSRYKEAMEAKEHAAHNAEAGRHYVHAYAGFVHYVLGMQQQQGEHHE